MYVDAANDGTARTTVALFLLLYTTPVFQLLCMMATE